MTEPIDFGRYRRADLKLRIARARLLRQIARDDVSLADLLTFARSIGDRTVADSVSAFRSAQDKVLKVAQAELDGVSS